ncbi:hypothetical protein DASC09_030190 [Saccharomycopsis crataegensis]|uniref:Uncharacterized protein n=1 Tax=Saccharomycopsis crataegensis TaxID=43959 RepID=A0AAV5QLU0_9ASCO|nr:hypothetical protein DASC09_030190 [Saccharomycopsis crataegensis]
MFSDPAGFKANVERIRNPTSSFISNHLLENISISGLKEVFNYRLSRDQLKESIPKISWKIDIPQDIIEPIGNSVLNGDPDNSFGQITTSNNKLFIDEIGSVHLYNVGLVHRMLTHLYGSDKSFGAPEVLFAICSDRFHDNKRV